MRRALCLARRGLGSTAPNPMVGAVLVKRGRVIGEGWHRRAGAPHAEVEALSEAAGRGLSPQGATLYVTLEPCCTTGRTPPCTDALVRAGIARVVCAATDPNPKHAGRGFEILRAAGIRVEAGILAEAATRLNEAFNHWIVERTPFVTVKAAMTLDGKTATAAGESKWITGEAARRHAMRLRAESDAILVGVNTVLADDPGLTVRGVPRASGRRLRRLVLDGQARTPLDAQLVSDEWRSWTTVYVSAQAPARRREALARQVEVVVVPVEPARSAPDNPRRRRAALPDARPRLDLGWILHRLGQEQVTCLLVEGGGTVNAAFLERGLAQRVAFYYAPKVLGEAAGRAAVAGCGFGGGSAIPRLGDVVWRRVGGDLFLTARLQSF